MVQCIYANFNDDSKHIFIHKSKHNVLLSKRDVSCTVNAMSYHKSWRSFST